MTNSLTASSATSTSAGAGAPQAGSQTPRINVVPPYVHSYGDEVNGFMASIGRPGDPWQQEIVRVAFGVQDDGLWAAYELMVLVARQNGKGWVTDAIELGGLFLFREALILHSAHVFKTSRAAFNRLVELCENNDWLRKRVNTVSRSKGDEGIYLTKAAGGGSLQFIARTDGTRAAARGLTGSTTVFDEAFALTAGQYQAQTPTLSTIPNPRIIYTSTPPDEDSGPMPDDAMLPSVRKRGHRGADRTACFEWSPPPGYKVTPEFDADMARQCNPAEGIRIAEWFLRKQHGAFVDAGKPEKYATEHLGLWHDKEDRGWFAFLETDWKVAQDPDSTNVGRPAYCIGVSRDLGIIYIGAAGRREDGKRHLELVDVFPADTGKLVGGLKKRIGKFNPIGVAIDPAGLAAYLIPDIEKHCGITVLQPGGREVAAACASVYAGISSKEAEARDVRVRPHPKLDAAARAADWKDRGDSKVFDRRNDDAPDVEPIVTVALADHILATAPRQASAPWAFYG